MEWRKLKNNIESVKHYTSKKGFLKGIEKFKSESNLTLNFSNDLNIVVSLKHLGFNNDEIEAYTGKPLSECLVYFWAVDKIDKGIYHKAIPKYIYDLGLKDRFIKEADIGNYKPHKVDYIYKKLNEIELKEKMSDLI